MSDRSDPAVLDYIEDIREAVEKIERYVDDMTFEEFAADDKTVDAVLRNLEILGEASKLIPADVREQEPDIPWSEMAGMRDKLIHGYATVDLNIVWHTVSEDLPQLRPKLESLASELEE